MDEIPTGIGRFALLVIDCPGPAGHPFCLVTVSS
jgi:hypothetical protein